MPRAEHIYLDHAATTPVRPEARAAVGEGLARWANPSSPHAAGRAARAALEQARDAIAAALGWDGHVILTSGATEAAAIALGQQAHARPAIVSTVEHLAVLRQRPDGVPAPVGADGAIDLGRLRGLLAEHRGAVVAVQHVNPETGVIQPLDAVHEATRDAGGLLFVDAAQSAGKLALPRADLIAVSAHKLGGPPGVGALLVRDLGALRPLKGAQEQGYRAGTENLPAVLGFAAALAAGARDDWLGPQRAWRDALEATVAAEGGYVVGGSPRLPTIGAYRLPGLGAAAALVRLDLAGIAVSAGSACSAGSIHASHVLTAMGYDAAAAGEVIRVSFGWTTTAADVARFAEAWTGLAREARARAA